MAKRTYLSAISSALVAALLAGCGGGGGSTPPTTTTTPQTGGNGNVTMTLSVPARTQNSVVKGGKKSNYVSYSTHGLEVSWERYTGASDNFGHTQVCIGNPTNASCGSLSPNFVTNVSPGLVSTNITCGNQATPGASYSCTIVIPAPAGYNDFQISLWDQSPASNGTNGFGGAFNVFTNANPSGANMLSYALVKDQQVLGSSSNTFNIILHPVIHTMYLALAPNTLVVGAAAPGTTINPTAPGMTFYGIDADGNTIHAASAAETYVDLNGNAVALKVTPNPVLPGSPVGTTATMHLNQPASAGTDDCLALGANGGLTNPLQSACVVTYNGGDIASVGYSGNAYTGCPGACSSDAANVSVTGTNLNFTRSVNGPIIVPTEPTLNPLVTPIDTNYGVVARDTFTYVSNHTNGTILKYNTSGLQTTYGGAVPNAPVGPYGVTQGPDNQIWFADAAAGKIGALNLQTGAFMAPIATSGWPNAIVTGADNNMYFTEFGGLRVGEIQIIAGTQFTPPTYHLWESAPMAAGSTPNQITNGSDGYVWFTDTGANAIGSIKPGNNVGTVNVCSTLQKLNPPGAPVSTTLNAPIGITTGSDNYLYVAESGTNLVDKIALPGNGGCGIITSTFTLQHNGRQLTTGADGNVYGMESDGATILRISPAGQMTEFPYSAGLAIGNIFSGSDGKIWLTAASTTSLYYFTP